jgi:hypothetical protein
MVALPFDMRDAAFLQARAAYARLCAVHAKAEGMWNERTGLPNEIGPWLRSLNELRLELRQAHSNFDAALRLFFREIGSCPACQMLSCSIHSDALSLSSATDWRLRC